MYMKKLTTIDYAVDVASGSYGIVNIQNILGVMTVYIHFKNKDYNGVLKALEQTSEQLEKTKEELEKIKDGDDIV